MTLASIALDDKYTLSSGRVLLSGTQALVRLPIMQQQRDAAAGLNTAGFVTGYRGSPLGGIDTEFWRAEKHLQRHNIRFQAAVNEDLAATAVWGSQQVGLFQGARYDGVFSMWYGKGPGVDRSGDALRHANLAGTAKYGGVLALAGDDHTCKSSTTAHQTEYAFMDAMIPVLNPSGVQEFIDYGLIGVAMSRFSGCWIALKLVGETADSTASVAVDPGRGQLVIPREFELPDGGLNLRVADDPLAQEERLHKFKLYAALAFARENHVNKTVIGGQRRRFGIVTAGKSYLDVRQALNDLGISAEYAESIGLSIYKVGMTWPLEREGIRKFAEGLEEILVVEEKRALIENQLKEQLYNWRADVRPRVIGKFDEEGVWILPSTGELTPGQIARAIAGRINRFHTSAYVDKRLAFLNEKEESLKSIEPGIKRIPYFCSGCPHNTSTKVPEDSRAIAGIGCHYMALWMDRRTATFTHMGGEGATWIGQAPFTDEPHVFSNLGDGTYFHSGILAIRAAVAAGVNITYKILYNDAVAMTGGQPMDGPLSPQIITRQVAAEGVERVVVVADEPDKYPSRTEFATGTTIHHRDELDTVQRDLRTVKGVTVIVYDQTCAAEKRRRRKRGTYPDPAKRVIINELVCEGCGDCSLKSNCLSVIPIETEFGRKRMIEQSSCNKDYSCVNGFCPSFVTVLGGDLRKPNTKSIDENTLGDWTSLPVPTLPTTEAPYGILVTGVGGTGIVTIGALLAMAAHIEGKGCSVLDMAGLAQKGGAVLSHIKISNNPDDIHAVRLASGGARLILGCDLVVAADAGTMSKIESGNTYAVINRHEAITGDFTHSPDMKFPGNRLEKIIDQATDPAHSDFIEATSLASALLGDTIAVNLFMLGYAWQKGLIPVSAEALERAIELNGVAIDANKRAFLWGRRAAHDLAAVTQLALPASAIKNDKVSSTTIEDMVARRARFLTEYQNASYSRRYSELVARVQAAEGQSVPGGGELTFSIARAYFKLLSYKDEYEVARLFTNGAFSEQLERTFEGDIKLRFHLAPPIISRRDPETGEMKKREFGPWMLPVFRMLARLKSLRGTPLDIFGYSDERRIERQLITEYETVVDTLLEGLNRSNHSIAVEIAGLPEQARGYGHVKLRNLQTAKLREAELLKEYLDPAPRASAAE
jgi:indolepyruvate ferredoxin oxidoreductase